MAEITRKVPSLSMKGWVNTVPEMVEKLLDYYFLSDHSQSDWYEIFSLPYHVAVQGNSPNQIRSLMTNDLMTYFGRYFPDNPSVQIDVIDKTSAGSDIARYEIQTEVIVVEGGTQYSVAKAIQVLNSQITILDKLNNGT